MDRNTKLYRLLLLSVLFVNSDIVLSKSNKRRIRGSRCTYTFIVNEVNNDSCLSIPSAVQADGKSYNYQKLQRKSFRNDNSDLEMKIQKLETQFYQELAKNMELTAKLTQHGNMLDHATKIIKDYDTNFTSLIRTVVSLERKLHQQKEVTRTLDRKVSNIMLDVVEVNSVLSRSLPSKDSASAQKTIKVESSANIHSCGIMDDTRIFKDCQDVKNRGQMESGVYYITTAYSACPMPVWCDMDTRPGGWLVIQRRQDGKVSFNQTWKTYKDGFGDIAGEFWLGNDNIFLLTNQNHYRLRVDLWDFDGNRVYAMYNAFKIDGERDGYRLHTHEYSGSANNGFSRHNKMKFSTPDRDNDQYNGYHCAKEWEAGWWFNNCWFAFLNGPYYNTTSVKYRGISWNEWKPQQLKKTEMKILPVS